MSLGVTIARMSLRPLVHFDILYQSFDSFDLSNLFPFLIQIFLYFEKIKDTTLLFATSGFFQVKKKRLKMFLPRNVHT